MVEAETVASLTQFGAAGLIGWMWLTERRAAGVRERQAAELVEQVRRDREAMEVLVAVVKENTRAMTTLEAGQRGLRSLVARLVRGEGGTPRARPEEAAPLQPRVRQERATGDRDALSRGRSV